MPGPWFVPTPPTDDDVITHSPAKSLSLNGFFGLAVVGKEVVSNRAIKQLIKYFIGSNIGCSPYV
jgi:hypothetical protein